MSATDDEKLLRAWCRRRGGVSGVVGGRLVLALGVGGGLDREEDLLKKDGRLEKRPEAVVEVDDEAERVLLAWVWVELVELVDEERVEMVGWWSAMASVPAHGRAGTGQRRSLYGLQYHQYKVMQEMGRGVFGGV
jgi:hypothetical protein